MLEYGVPENKCANSVVKEWIFEEKVRVDLLNGAAATAVFVE